MLRSPWLWLGFNLLAIAAFTATGPAEKSLGQNVRVVYLHGAWVWTALAGFSAAALTGLGGLLARRKSWQLWSLALGRTALLFWITYLPISMWAMQTNWNGMFLAEPRFRVAVVFALGGLLLQIGAAIADDPAWAAAANLLFAGVLFWVLYNTPNVMHPSSPIMSSDARRIQLFFFGLLGLAMALAAQIAHLWYTAGKRQAKKLSGSTIESSEA